MLKLKLDLSLWGRKMRVCASSNDTWKPLHATKFGSGEDRARTNVNERGRHAEAKTGQVAKKRQTSNRLSCWTFSKKRKTKQNSCRICSSVVDVVVVVDEGEGKGHQHEMKPSRGAMKKDTNMR